MTTEYEDWPYIFMPASARIGVLLAVVFLGITEVTGIRNAVLPWIPETALWLVLGISVALLLVDSIWFLLMYENGDSDD